jgi:DNA-binding transcriptional regulator PaaX
VAARLTQQCEIDSAEAFRHYVPMLTQWRRLPYLDPGLSKELLPEDWNAVTAREIFQQAARRTGRAEPAPRTESDRAGGVGANKSRTPPPPDSA